MITGGEPVYPRDYKYQGHNGINLREYYAGLFMQGLLAAWGQHDVTDYADLASDAVLAADKLINELNKNNGN